VVKHDEEGAVRSGGHQEPGHFIGGEMDAVGFLHRHLGHVEKGVFLNQAPLPAPVEEGAEIFPVKVVVIVGGPGVEVGLDQVRGDLGQGQIPGKIHKTLIDIALVFPGLNRELSLGLLQILRRQVSPSP